MPVGVSPFPAQKNNQLRFEAQKNLSGVRYAVLKTLPLEGGVLGAALYSAVYLVVKVSHVSWLSRNFIKTDVRYLSCSDYSGRSWL